MNIAAVEEKSDLTSTTPHSYRKTHAIRLERTNSRGELATRTLPGYHAQALECLLEICSYLAVRYPSLFIVTRAPFNPADPRTHGDSLVGDEGGAVTSIRNVITGEFWDFEEIERRDGPDWNPMRYAGRESSGHRAEMMADNWLHSTWTR